MELGQYLLLIALLYFNHTSRTKNILLVFASVLYVVYLTVYVNVVTGHMVMNGFYILLITYFVLSILPGGKK